MASKYVGNEKMLNIEMNALLNYKLTTIYYRIIAFPH